MPGLPGHLARPHHDPSATADRCQRRARRHECPGAGPGPRAHRHGTGTGASTRTLDDELLDRAARDDYHQWLPAPPAAGGCVRPIRLRGTIRDIDPATGEVLRTLDTEDLPDKVIYLPCGDRRASVCPPCAETYRADTYQLIRAGLAGGKGVPESVAIHPCVFATFTAPSFGPVHTRVVSRPTAGSPGAGPAAKPATARTAGGSPAASGTRKTDACLGTAAVPGLLRLRTPPSCGTPTPPSCGGAPPSPSAASSPSSPSRTASGCSCPTPRSPSSSPAAWSTSTPSSASTPSTRPPRAHRPAAPGITADVLADLIRQVAASTWFATVAHPARPSGWDIRWGAQLDPRIVRLTGGGQVTDVAVASYLAKYATKSTEPVGIPPGRITADNAAFYGNPRSHQGRLIRAAWHLGSHPHPDFQALRRWAHMLGYRGHFATKSRRYSTTLRALRAARADYRRRQQPARHGEHGDQAVITITTLEWAGRAGAPPATPSSPSRPPPAPATTTRPPATKPKPPDPRKETQRMSQSIPASGTPLPRSQNARLRAHQDQVPRPVRPRFARSRTAGTGASSPNGWTTTSVAWLRNRQHDPASQARERGRLDLPRRRWLPRLCVGHRAGRHPAPQIRQRPHIRGDPGSMAGPARPVPAWPVAASSPPLPSYFAYWLARGRRAQPRAEDFRVLRDVLSPVHRAGAGSKAARPAPGPRRPVLAQPASASLPVLRSGQRRRRPPGAGVLRDRGMLRPSGSPRSPSGCRTTPSGCPGQRGSRGTDARNVATVIRLPAPGMPSGPAGPWSRPGLPGIGPGSTMTRSTPLTSWSWCLAYAAARTLGAHLAGRQPGHRRGRYQLAATAHARAATPPRDQNPRLRSHPAAARHLRHRAQAPSRTARQRPDRGGRRLARPPDSYSPRPTARPINRGGTSPATSPCAARRQESATSRSTTPAAPAHPSWPRSTSTPASPCRPHGTARSPSPCRSTPRSLTLAPKTH